jgi:hypothetical protein
MEEKQARFEQRTTDRYKNIIGQLTIITNSILERLKRLERSRVILSTKSSPTRPFSKNPSLALTFKAPYILAPIVD